MTSWQYALEYYILPHVSKEAVKNLLDLLLLDDPTVIQASVTNVCHVRDLKTTKITCGCAITHLGWFDFKFKSVAEAHEYFETVCDRHDSTSSFWCWFDFGDRGRVFAELAQYLKLYLGRKSVAGINLPAKSVPICN